MNRLYGAGRPGSRKYPFAPSVNVRMPASLNRVTVGAAPPLATSTPSSGWTIPMSVARIERTGPTCAGTSDQ